MPQEFIERLRAMPEAKRLAVAIYGESVAAYRYSVLAEKALPERHRQIFSQMKQEEEGHQRALQEMADRLYPDGDFLLSPSDKELVIAGTRMLEVTDAESFHKAMRFLHDTEKRTGRFYLALHDLMPGGDLGEFFKVMAEECFEHGDSLLEIEPPNGPVAGDTEQGT